VPSRMRCTRFDRSADVEEHVRLIQRDEKQRGRGKVTASQCFVSVPFVAYYFRYSVEEFLSADWAKQIPSVMVNGDWIYYSDANLDRFVRKSPVMPTFIPAKDSETRHGPPVLLNAQAASNGLGLSRGEFAGVVQGLPHFNLASMKLYDGRVIAALTKYWLNWPPGSSEAYMEAISSLQHYPRRSLLQVGTRELTTG
jgi:hypothetical protein